MNSVRARIFVLALLTFLSSMIAFANHAYANIINGDISIVCELKTPLSEVEPDDLARVKKLCLSTPGYTFNTNNGSLTLDSNYDDSGAIIASSMDKTVVQNNHFSINVDPEQPLLTVEDELGHILGQFNLASNSFQSGTASITLKLPFADQDTENSEEDSQPSLLGDSKDTYPGQQSGHTYSAGVHVSCNDFNGKNADHKWWKKTSHPIKAAIDFAGSDCDYHLKAYKCAMSSYFTSSNHRCHGLQKSDPTNCSAWSGGSKHKNWPHVLWWR